MAKKKKISQPSWRQRRGMHTQRIVMGIFGVLIILSMVLALVAK